MRIRALVTATAVIAGVGVSGTIAASAATAGSTDVPCPEILVIGVPGTHYYHVPGPTPWQPTLNPAQPGAVISQVADFLGPERAAGRISYEQINHPADVGAVLAYRKSNAISVGLTTARIAQLAAACASTRFALIGYSNGAGVAGDVLHAIGHGKGPIPADRVVAGMLFSDPRRDAGRDQLVGPTVTGTGLDLPRPGGFGAVHDRTYQFCSAGDVICDNDPNETLLRPLMLRYANTENVTFVAQVLKELQRNGIDPAKWGKQYGVKDPVELVAKVSASVYRVDDYNRRNLHGQYDRLELLNINGRTATQWTADKLRDPNGVQLPIGLPQVNVPDQPNVPPAQVDPGTQAGLAAFAQFQQAVKTALGGKTLRQTLNDTGAVDVPRERLTSLVTRAVLAQDPSASPAVIGKAVAGLADLGDIVLAVSPYQLSRLANGSAQVAAGLTQLASGVPNPQAVVQTVCGLGQSAAAALAITADVVRMYEASAELPQIADVLDLLDPTTADGRQIFAAMPAESRTPEVRTAMTSLARFGKMLNSLDKQRIIGLAQGYGEMVARCDLAALIQLPGLLVQTVAVTTEVATALATHLAGTGLLPKSPASTPDTKARANKNPGTTQSQQQGSAAKAAREKSARELAARIARSKTGSASQAERVAKARTAKVQSETASQAKARAAKLKAAKLNAAKLNAAKVNAAKAKAAKVNAAKAKAAKANAAKAKAAKARAAKVHAARVKAARVKASKDRQARIRALRARVVDLGGGSGLIGVDGRTCTLTTIGYDASRSLIGLTSGACFGNDPANTGARVLAEANKRLGTVGWVYHVSRPGLFGGLDYAVIKFDPKKVRPVRSVGRLTVAGIGTPPAFGAPLCKQGRTTGLTCGLMMGQFGLRIADSLLATETEAGAPVVAAGGRLIGQTTWANGTQPITDVLADLNARRGAGAGFRPVSR